MQETTAKEGSLATHCIEGTKASKSKINRRQGKKITSRTPPVEYFKTRRKAVVVCPFDNAAGNSKMSPTTIQIRNSTND